MSSCSSLLLMLMAGTMVAIVGCQDQEAPSRLPVVATTSLVGDVVRTIGGTHASVTVLLPIGVDPHSFEPSPRDVATLSQARLVCINGLGLEGFLDPLIGASVEAGRVINVSSSLMGLPDAPESLKTHGMPDSAAEHEHGVDPHVWFVPTYVATWARTISAALGSVDPPHQTEYAAKADSFIVELEALDVWIREQIETVPREQRLLVTDHAALGHFARHYGLVQVGAMMPGFSTLAEPSARDVADLVRHIQLLGAPAIFVGRTSSAELARRVAGDAGIPVIPLFTGSLSTPDGPAADYVSFMRFNTSAIVSALRAGGQ